MDARQALSASTDSANAIMAAVRAHVAAHPPRTQSDMMGLYVGLARTLAAAVVTTNKAGSTDELTIRLVQQVLQYTQETR